MIFFVFKEEFKSVKLLDIDHLSVQKLQTHNGIAYFVFVCLGKERKCFIYSYMASDIW